MAIYCLDKSLFNFQRLICIPRHLRGIQGHALYRYSGFWTMPKGWSCSEAVRDAWQVCCYDSLCSGCGYKTDRSIEQEASLLTREDGALTRHSGGDGYICSKPCLIENRMETEKSENRNKGWSAKPDSSSELLHHLPPLIPLKQFILYTYFPCTNYSNFPIIL